MSTSSARPDDLDGFATAGRGADRELQDGRAGLIGLLSEFQSGTDWGVFDPSSLLDGFQRYLELNEVDAQWVSQIATAFRRAGGDGSLARLPDAAIQASLRAAGLDGVRESVAYMDPIAFGAPSTTGYANDPVNTANGNFVDVVTDLSFGGLLGLLGITRVYNSRSDRDDGPFGARWSSWASARLRPHPDGAEYEGPDGQRALFPRMGAGYGRIAGVNAQVEVLEAGLALDWFSGERWEFDDAGRPRLVTRGPGTEVRLRHDDRGRLVGLRHGRGRLVEVSWDGARIVGVASSDGRAVTYRYDELGNLTCVDGPSGSTHYTVDEHSRVVSVTDADGVVALVNTYDEYGRVTEQLSPFGRRTSFSYLPGNVTVTADDSGGPMSTYVHDRSGWLVTVIDGHGQRFTKNYDDWGNPVAIIDRNGAVTVQEWDERARLIRRTLSTGAWFSFSYDESDRVLAVTASTGAEVRYRYEGAQRSPSEIVDPEGGCTRLTVEAGRVHDVTDPDGVTARFEYDRDGSLVAATNGDGNTARIERDDAGRAVATISPGGRRTTFEYDSGGLLSSRRGPAGDRWRYEYSPGGRATAVVDPLGARTEISYGPHGAPAEIVDPLGGSTARRYDTFGNVVGVTAADGAKWEFGYDALLRLTTRTDPAGATWLREYDVEGNLTGSLDPTGIHHTATVDQAGRIVALNDGLTSSTFEFDELGRMLARRRPDGTEWRATYDRCGRRTSEVDPHGGITRYEYSPGGRVHRIVAPSGRAMIFEYDRCGRVAARIDAAGRRWTYRYDADGALVERVGPTGETETFGYDSGGRTVHRSAPGAGTTMYSYDLAGRIVSVTDRLAGTRRFEYDAAGRLVQAVDANGDITRYTVNIRGFLVRVTDPLGGMTTRSYDEVGRLVSETNPLGRVSTFAYDAAGRLVERSDGAGTRVRCSYDVSGRIRTLSGAADAQITVTRDRLGRPVRLDEPGRPHQQLRWDRSGRLVERRSGELTMRWRYDTDGCRTALGYPDGSETIYPHDEAGRTVAMDHPLLGRVRLDRDPAGRLIGLHGDDMSAVWHYDAGELVGYDIEHGGSRRATRLTRDATGRVSAVSVNGQTRHYGYDPAGQLVSATGPDGEFFFTYDANGRLVRETGPGGNVKYSHDAAGQLISAQRGSSRECRYEYDGAGRRVRERGPDQDRTYHWDWLGRLSGVDTVSVDGGTHSTRLVVDALGELSEVDGTPLMWDTADPVAPLTWLGHSAVIGDGRPWAVVSAAAQAAGEDPWLDRDWQGTIGTQPSDPWGVENGAGSPAGDLRLGFRGELDVDGLVWLRNRAYGPADRAFLLPDPRPPVPGTPYTANPYHYAGNDPINHVDPLGLRPVTDAELQQYRDQMGRNLLDRSADWVGDHWGEIATAGLVVAGGIMIATGVGTPIGVGILVGVGSSAAAQYAVTGQVDWEKTAISGVFGGLAGGAGYAVSQSTIVASAGTQLAARGYPILGASTPYVAGGTTAGASSGVLNETFDAANGGGFDIDTVLGEAVAGGVFGFMGGAAPVADDLFFAGTATREAARLQVVTSVSGSFWTEHAKELIAHGIEPPSLLPSPLGRTGSG